jgi:hypothetical protein
LNQRLFYANSTRFSSAMMGADYGVFANGRWYMAKNVQEMRDWLEFKLKRSEGPRASPRGVPPRRTSHARGRQAMPEAGKPGEGE